ncbi:hypothetical protein, partial [Mesorhizobium sp. M7A.T.Ca.US.000.02.1.1]|uniref:hypothetical protein n=1 Tax=Mesorhizobium sp. M7A.T.Ca.US.000.02.1.1 TaxID=2496792 RepID=UPI0019D43BF4
KHHQLAVGFPGRPSSRQNSRRLFYAHSPPASPLTWQESGRGRIQEPKIEQQAAFGRIRSEARMSRSAQVS